MRETTVFVCDKSSVPIAVADARTIVPVRK